MIYLINTVGWLCHTLAAQLKQTLLLRERIRI